MNENGTQRLSRHDGGDEHPLLVVLTTIAVLALGGALLYAIAVKTVRLYGIEGSWVAIAALIAVAFGAVGLFRRRQAPRRGGHRGRSF